MPTIRKLAVALVLGVAYAAATAAAIAAEPDEYDKWSGTDKKQHFVAGFMIASVVTANTGNPLSGALVGVTIGVLKEVVDDVSFRYSERDALASAVGAFAGAYVTGLIIVPGAVLYRIEW